MKRLLQPFQARLSRTVALGVLLSIVTIEAVILIPSYWRRERELIDYMQRISTAKVVTLARWSQAAPEFQDPVLLAQRLANQTDDPISLWKGLAFYDQ